MRNQIAMVKGLVQTVGMTETMKVVVYRLLGFKRVSVRVEDIRRKVLVRLNNSDLPLLNAIFCSDECEMNLSWTPETIIDLGANIGLTALKLRKRFPTVRVIAVEPDPDTAEVCALNLKNLSDCIVLHRAVGFEAARVVCSNPQAQAISRRFSACPDDQLAGVDTISIGVILAQCKCLRPILVKMDIEGTEEECFQHADEWLEYVDAVLCEAHSKLVETEICNTLTQYGFSIQRIGEKICGERTAVDRSHS